MRARIHPPTADCLPGWVWASRLLLPAFCLLLSAFCFLPSASAGSKDYDVPSGHYYEQGTRTGTPDNSGFVVHDDESAPMWGEFRRLGGSRALGYPISRRYECDGAICQAFQYAVFKWRPDWGEVELLSVFDWLHVVGRDGWLDRLWNVPPWSGAVPQGKDEDHDPLDLLEANQALKSAYWRLGAHAPTVYGLPRAYRESGYLSVLRTQRAVLFQSVDSPGQVAILPAGQMFRDAGLIPAYALVPLPAPEPSYASPPTHITVPDLGIDAAVVSLDMERDGSLPIPDDPRVVAWYSYGARLGESGNKVLAGHVDWNGERGVFWRLREATPEQVITLYGNDDQAFEYRVEWVRDYPAESLAGLAALRPSGSADTLTLVTCSGRFDFATRSYEDRQVLRAVRYGPSS